MNRKVLLALITCLQLTNLGTIMQRVFDLEIEKAYNPSQYISTELPTTLQTIVL